MSYSEFDDKAKPHIGDFEPLNRFVDFLFLNHLNFWQD